MNSETNHSSRRIVIAVDLDYFFAQCEEIRRPELRDRPVVVCVYSGRSETSGAVSTANYFARKLGVKSGTPITNAKKALIKHPDSVFLPIDHEHYEAVSDRVMRIVKSVDISLPFEQASIDEAFLDVTKIAEGDYSLAIQIGQKIKSEIKDKERLSSTVGIGPNKLVAKMAVDSVKPDGFKKIAREEVQEFLGGMPVRRLIGIGPKIESKLASLNIRTIGDLSKYDSQILSENFGKNFGPELKRLASGLDDDPVQQGEIEQLSRIITLKRDAESFSFREALLPLAQDIANRLQALKLTCHTIGIIAITSELKTKSIERTVATLTDSEDQILGNSTELFRELFSSSEQFRVRRAGIRVSGLERQNGEKPAGQETLSSFLPSF